MPDIAKIKRNIGRMIDQGAPEADIDAYLGEEGVTLDMLHAPSAPAEPAAKPYSLGPISALPELGARGINAIAQNVVNPLFGTNVPPRAPQPLQPLNLPVIGEPSAYAMGKGLVKEATSAATLPGDVLAGTVDPLSDEGIRRSTGAAMLMSPTSVRTLASRPATAPLSASEIKDVATSGYQKMTQESRATPLSGEQMAAISQDVQETLLANGPRPRRAKAVYDEMESLKQPKGGDLGDLIDARRNLADIRREGIGEEVAAAGKAIDRIDQIVDAIAPGTSTTLREMDKNYAIAKKSAEVETKLEDAQRQASTFGSGGNAGNKVKQTFRPMLEKGRDERLSPAVREAVERTVEPGVGVNALRPLAIFDPTQKTGLGLGAASLGTSLPFMLPGFLARQAYDRILANRAGKISETMRNEAPATLAQPGYSAGGPVALPALPSSAPGLLPLLPTLPERQPLRITVRPSRI